MSEPNLPDLDKLSPEARENIKNRVFRVFISSTCLDMQQERDRLLQDVFPRFRRLCKARGVELVAIDFRWGITEDQGKKGKTCGICLSEIQRSTFFIGLLGKRYGWTPKEGEIDKSDLDKFPILKQGVENGWSVTEMEFRLAALNEDPKMAVGFWFRSDNAPKPENLKLEDFQDDEPKRSQLTSLKEKLRAMESCPVAEYDSPQELGAQAEVVLKQWLDKYFPEGEKRAWLDRQDADQGAFERSRTKLYRPNRVDYRRLNQFVASQEQALVVVGDSGTGKSALLANWKKDELKDKFPDVEVVAHYVSASENSDLPANILRRLIESIDPKAAEEETFARMNPDAYPGAFSSAVVRYLAENPKKRLLFIIDGLNQLSDVGDVKELRWIPELPDRAQYLLSTVSSDSTFEIIQKKWDYYEIKTLDSERILDITAGFLENRGKSLTSDLHGQENKIVDFKLASNSLVLTTLLDELCYFGVYEKLDEEIDRYVSATDENDFFGKVFERLEKSEQFIETNPEKRGKIVERLSLLIALSRFGLSENELCEVADLPKETAQTTVVTFLGMLDAQLVNRSGRYSFSHGNIRQAALKRYADAVDDTRRLIVGKFSELIRKRQEFVDKFSPVDVESADLTNLISLLVEIESEYARGLQEVPFQYLQLQSWEELRRFLLDFGVLRNLYNKTFNCDFCAYWNAATGAGVKEFQFAPYLDLNESDPANWFNLGCVATEYKDFSTAEESYQRALEIRRELAKENPKAYKPDVATILNNLALLHSSTDRLSVAEKEYQEALEIRRDLVQENPKVYKQYVAETLNNLANLHKKTNRLSDAEKEYKEVLGVYRKLAKENPNAYKPYVAGTLNNLAFLHSSTNSLSDAETEYQEALDTYRELAQENSNIYKPYVATTLNNWAILHSDTNRLSDAEKEYQEALEIRRDLVQKNPKAYKQYLAETLNNLAILHSSTNRLSVAEKEYQEALEIRRDLAQENPKAYKQYVAETLNNLAILHFSMNRLSDAEKEYQEALDAYRELTQENPNAYKPYVVAILNNLAILLIHTKRNKEAKPLLVESISYSQEFAEIRSDCQKYYVQALALLSICEKDQDGANEQASF